MRSHRRTSFGSFLGRLSAVAAATVCLLGVAACKKSTQTNATSRAPTNPKEKRFPITGEIVNVRKEDKILEVFHDEIKGYMPAMTMEFRVGPGDLELAKPKQRIRAEMVDPGDGEFRLEKIWVVNTTEAERAEAAAKALNQDTVILGKNAFRELGEKVPSFALFDQEGRLVESGRYRGKQVMVNFIFTRCPIQTMCPAAVQKFQDTQKRAKEAGVKNLELLSISLDPEYDTPGVLKEYVQSRQIDTANYTFLTGPQSAVKSLLAQFGVRAEFEGDLLKHTLATVLIDDTGKIIWRADGGSWEPDEFVAKMRKG